MLLSWWQSSCIVAIDCQLQLAISGNCAKLSRNEVQCKVRALDMQSRVPFAFCQLETRFILLVSLAWKTSWHLSQNKTYQGKFKLHSAHSTQLGGWRGVRSEGCGLTRVITDATWQSEHNRVIPNASGPARQEGRVTVISPVAIWTFELGTRSSLAARQRIWHSTLARFLWHWSALLKAP